MANNNNHDEEQDNRIANQSKTSLVPSEIAGGNSISEVDKQLGNPIIESTEGNDGTEHAEKKIKTQENKVKVDGQVVAAHAQADKDIANDPDLSMPVSDLDEGELARLGEKNNPIE